MLKAFAVKPQVFVTRHIPDAALEKVRASCDVDLWEDEMQPPYETLIERSHGKDGVLSMLTDRIDAGFMDAAGLNLKVVSQMAVGYDNIDVNAAKKRGIAIGNTPGVLTDTTANLAFALLLAAARRIVEGVRYIENDEWKMWHPTVLLGRDVSGATLGIVGFGRIGKAVARRAAGFNMRILTYSPSLTDEAAHAEKVERVDLEFLMRESDFVSLHTPLNDATRHLINHETLKLMKPTAILVNTARGGVVDQDALYDALVNGVIGGAALDVTTPEPLRGDHPLLKLPNVVIVPHIGSATVGTRGRMASMAADNLIAGVTGKPLPNAVVVGTRGISAEQQ
jgi:lactate dehydrogenase-like 2-hydroxyacid dehydrogenase